MIYSLINIPKWSLDNLLTYLKYTREILNRVKTSMADFGEIKQKNITFYRSYYNI